MQLTSAQFNAELFAMANSAEFDADADFHAPITEYIELDAQHKGTLTYAPVEGTLQINGLTLSTEVKAADAVTGLPTYTVDEKTITVYEGVTGTIEVYYEMETASARSISIDNMASATGEALLKWPVYGAGDTCDKNAIKGYVYIRVYKCRVTAMPGFDSSYKSAATNQITLAAMDAKRTDGAAYKLTYVENAAEAAAAAGGEGDNP